MAEGIAKIGNPFNMAEGIAKIGNPFSHIAEAPSDVKPSCQLAKHISHHSILVSDDGNVWAS